MTRRYPICQFKTTHEIIRLDKTVYVRIPLSLWNEEDLQIERDIHISYETFRFGWNRFGSLFVSEIRRKRVDRMEAGTHWELHLVEVFVEINGEAHYLRRAVDYEEEVLESFGTKRRDRKEALKFLGKTMERFDRPHTIASGTLPFYGAAMVALAMPRSQKSAAGKTTGVEFTPAISTKRTGPAPT